MNPLDFHKVADNLVNQEGAAELRSAISRAYYGTFLFCCKKINDLGFNLPRDAAAHVIVSKYLNNCGVFKLKSVASQLTNLRLTRNFADYDLNNKKVEKIKNVKGNVLQAKKIVKTISDCFNIDSDQIALKIEDYRKKVLKLP